MTLARRLIPAGGRGSFDYTPLADSFALTSPDDGSWGYVDPRGFYYNGATYFTWIDGQSGDAGVSKYVHATGITTSTVIDAGWEADDHATPSVIVRSSDHRIVVAYSKHNGSLIKRWLSTNAEDISAGSAATGSTGISQATYCTLVQLDGVTDAPVYWFYRDRPTGTTGQLEFVTSTDGLSTWGSLTGLFYSTTNTPYWRIGSDWDRYIHVFTTNKEPNLAGAAIFHFYIDGTTGNRYMADGTQITASLPLTAADLGDPVWEGVGDIGYCIVAGVSVDADTGYPAALLRGATDSGQTDNSMVVARWTGAAWQVNEVTTTGGTLPGFVYSPSGGIHPTDPDVVYIGKMVSGKSEMYRYISPDAGTSWVGTALTSGSSVHNVYPEVPRHVAAGLKVIWPRGTITSDTDYNFGMQGWA